MDRPSEMKGVREVDVAGWRMAMVARPETFPSRELGAQIDALLDEVARLKAQRDSAKGLMACWRQEADRISRAVLIAVVDKLTLARARDADDASLYLDALRVEIETAIARLPEGYRDAVHSGRKL